MITFGFGQRTGQIVQTAYVVPSIRPAIDWWIKDGRAGPFFLLDSFTGSDQRYRGQPTTADVSIARGFAGHMMIELIQPRDRQPSVYKRDHRSTRLRLSPRGNRVRGRRERKAGLRGARLSRGILRARAKRRHGLLHG